jgi:hypothetical protein
MKKYQEFLGESLQPRRLGKNSNGMTVYQIGNRYFVISYSSMADETAVFQATNAQGDVDDYTEVVSIQGGESDAEMLRLTLSAIANGRVPKPDERLKIEAEQAVIRLEDRIGELERHIQGAGRELKRLQMDLASAETAMKKGTYRVIFSLADFRPGSKPWDR